MVAVSSGLRGAKNRHRRCSPDVSLIGSVYGGHAGGESVMTWALSHVVRGCYRHTIMVDSVSPALARRIALAAQGFGRPRPATVGTRQLNGTIERLGLLQLDSVNVYERSHYLPVFARLGAYDKAALDRLTFPRRGGYVEYWAHEAAVIPVEAWPLLRWRMEGYRDYFAQRDSWASSNAPMLDWLRAELAANGPMPASAIEHDSNVRRGPWAGPM
jgi:uncharacterized protein YcaQ